MATFGFQAVARLCAGALAAAVLATVPGHVGAGAGSLKQLTFEALRRVARIEEPQISPDGSRVAYIRRLGDYKADEILTQIELVDVATGRVRALTRDRKGIATIRWSPSGDRLAFTAITGGGKVAQLFSLPMDGGDPLQVTSSKGGVTGFAWKPDGSGFVYAATDPPAPPKPAGFVPAFEVTDEHFLTREPSLPVVLWTARSDGSGARRLTRGALSVGALSSDQLSYTPDGKSILALLQPDAVFAHLSESKTMRVDAITGAASPIVAAGVDGGGTLSPDGTKVALKIPRHGSLYLQSDLSVRALADGSEVFNGKGIDRNVHWASWLPDGQSLYVATADGVRSVLWRLGADGSASKVDLGDVDISGAGSVAADGAVAFVGVTRTNPGDIYVLPAGATQPQKLTNENPWLAGYALARRERIDWVSDGMNCAGVLTYPIAYDPTKKYPLVLNVHGGPISTSTWDFNRFDTGLTEMLATHGYLVFEPNYRGSDNSGDAFTEAIVGKVTSGPGRDNLAAVEALEKLGIVDTARIGVGGWSGGGLQTSWLIGHATFWAAAVSGAGVDDWFEQSVLADINEEFARVLFAGATPWTAAGRKAYADESPITYADHIVTPLLILSDVGDQRVPITQSFQLYRALHDRGKTVAFEAWPRAGHFPTDPVAVESVFKAWDGWFVRWLK
jgi:dipeptidyl aminopeptidase/acylaminoacyl peptidase